ncbi:unnamed protein product [Camellia sinensis]
MQKKLGGGDAPVSGKLSPVTIRWSNITCSFSDKSSKAGETRKISCNNGAVRIREGQIVASPRFAYVRQEDLFFFFSQLTFRETLSLAAELKLQEISYVEERDEYVNKLLFRLGLGCADSRVGDAKVRGISGGKKKHLSMACELITSPSVIVANEPTTGLDAFQAEKVMETLHQLAQDGLTVICALVYAGPARDEPLYGCPELVNPAELLADLMSIDNSSAESVYSSQKRIHGLVESFSQQTSSILYATPLVRRETSRNSMNLRKKTIVKKKGGWWRQFWLLLKRAWMQASRDGPTNKVRARMSIIFGSVFWRMGRSQSSIQDRMGLLQEKMFPYAFISKTMILTISYELVLENRIFVHLSGFHLFFLPSVAAINTAMASLTKTGGVFPKERAIVDRECAKGSYALGPYLLSKLLAEIPVGAAFPLLFGTFCTPWLVFIQLFPAIRGYFSENRKGKAQVAFGRTF